MKKVIIICVLSGIALLGCQTMNTSSQKETKVGVANPASEFCIKQGGKSEIRKNADGSEYGVCVLPNGQAVEEWDYFRKHSPK